MFQSEGEKLSLQKIQSDKNYRAGVNQALAVLPMKHLFKFKTPQNVRPATILTNIFLKTPEEQLFSV